MSETYVQRMRVHFATGDTVKYVGHLDFVRAWERAVRRAALPLAYSQGFHPQARLHFAAALPVGITGEDELVDVFLDAEIDPQEFVVRLNAALPAGVRVIRAEPVPRQLPSLQAVVTSADYRLEIESSESEDVFCARLDALLASDHLPRVRRRGERDVEYDLRPLILSLRFDGRGDLGYRILVEMRSEPGATGRPDELLAELGFERALRRIARLSITLAEAGVAREGGVQLLDPEPVTPDACG